MKINRTMSAFLHILVNYGNDLETEAFLQKCLKLKSAERGLFVLVNNSAKSHQDTTFSPFSKMSDRQVQVINCPDNPGYFPAAQRALNELHGQEFKFVILSNTDLQILNEDFYELLLDRAPDKTIGGIAPSVRSELTQKECNPLYQNRVTKQKIHFLKLIYTFYPVAWSYHVLSYFKSLLSSERLLQPESFAYAPHGCFLILTDNYFQSGGDFSHPVRLYGEEIALAEKLIQMKLKVVLDPRLQILHRENGTELSAWHRATLSRRTFQFKQEAAEFLDRSFTDF